VSCQSSLHLDTTTTSSRRIVRQLPPPGLLTDYSQIRWWAAKVILANCVHGRHDPATYPDYSSQLWKIPLTGQAPTALTAVNTGRENSGFGGDLGDGDAWQLPSGTFLQSAWGVQQRVPISADSRRTQRPGQCSGREQGGQRVRHW
jgi:hypothetical protein